MRLISVLSYCDRKMPRMSQTDTSTRLACSDPLQPHSRCSLRKQRVGSGNGPGHLWSVRLLLSGSLLLLVSGCTSSSQPTPQLRIGMMPKLVGISYFDATEQGAREAAEELGVRLIYDGPTGATSEEQLQLLNGWVAQGVDVIAVAPNDPEAISKTLRGALEAGAKVLTWDTDANPVKSGRSLFVNQAPNEQIGQTLVDVMADGVRRRGGPLAGKYLIVSGTPTASNQNAWMEVMKRRIAEAYPEIELLPHLTPGEDHRRSLEQTAETLAANPDLRGVWGITSVSLPAAAKAVRDAGKQRDIYVTGLSLPSQMRDFVLDGTVEKFVLWDAVDLGYLTVHVAQRLAQGMLTDGVYAMGRLTDIEVRGGQVILGPPLIFDRDNIDQYQF